MAHEFKSQSELRVSLMLNVGESNLTTIADRSISYQKAVGSIFQETLTPIKSLTQLIN